MQQARGRSNGINGVNSLGIAGAGGGMKFVVNGSGSWQQIESQGVANEVVKNSNYANASDDVSPRVSSSIISNKDASSKKSKPVSCACKKSNCLKLYCQCFASSALCASTCRCLVCMNNPNYEVERSNAVALILEHDPAAFDVSAIDIWSPSPSLTPNPHPHPQRMQAAKNPNPSVAPARSPIA